MATVRLATAKLLRIRVLAASVLAEAPSATVLFGPPRQLTQPNSEASWQAMFDSLVAGTTTSMNVEHIIVVPKTVAEQILGTHHTKSAGIHLEGSVGPKMEIDAPCDLPAQQSCDLPAQQSQNLLDVSNNELNVAEVPVVASVPLRDVASLVQGGDVSHKSPTGTSPAPSIRKNYVKLSPAAAQLFEAAGNGLVEPLQSALRALEVAHDINTHHPDHGGTCLHIVAALSSDEAPQMVAELCRYGALVDARAYNNSTPLHWAAGAGNSDVVSELLRHGADASALSYTWGSNVFGKGSGQTPVHWAAESGHNECVQVFLDGPTPIAALFGDERGQLPEDLAQKEGHYQLSEFLQTLGSSQMVCLGVSTEASFNQVVPANSATQNEDYAVINAVE